ncbi:hypothetical protein C5167_037362 [Papaver somniferum]|uniref:Uncharacterized protein n=1 Tax=Papaver somniferum TaxID=3469 RepID=A0A4Y7IA86_PAPSO|nr:hypothetical protein C5167_037362 [Papaver somniferum]
MQRFDIDQYEDYYINTSICAGYRGGHIRNLTITHTAHLQIRSILALSWVAKAFSKIDELIKDLSKALKCCKVALA